MNEKENNLYWRQVIVKYVLENGPSCRQLFIASSSL